MTTHITNPLKVAYAAMPLSSISDASLPNLTLVAPTGSTNTETEESAATSSPSQSQLRRNINVLSRSSFVPEFVWDFADIPLAQTEDIGVPRIYFCEPAAAVYHTKTARAAFIMVTFNQIVVFENNMQEKKRSLACTVEFNDYRNTRVHRVVKDDGRDTSFVFVSYYTGNSSSQQPKHGILISFLDVVSRNFFIQACDQIGRLHCNERCASESVITPEDALDNVMMMTTTTFSENNKNSNNNATDSSPSQQQTWRVPILPFSGLVVDDAPKDPAQMLHRSLKNLLDKRAKRTDEDDEDHHNHILDRDALRAIQMPFRTLAASYEEHVEVLQRELDQMRQSDERKVRAAEESMTKSLYSLEEKKNLVRQNAANAGEQLAEWLALLQKKQQTELDATVRLSQKKQEYATELDDADAELMELYNERRWIEAESSKFSTAEYVQLLARRDALHQRLASANRAVDAELKEPGSSDILATEESAQNEQNATRENNRSHSTISTEASCRNVSLFSPTRVFNMYTKGSPTRHQNNSNNNSSNNKPNSTSSPTNGGSGVIATSARSRFAAILATNAASPKDKLNMVTAQASALSTTHSSLVSTPKPRPGGLTKPVRIEQSVQQTLQVNATLRKLLDAERDGTQEDKKAFADLANQVKEAEAKLQEILNEQAVAACDIQRVEGENGILRSRRVDLEQQEQELLQRLSEAGQMRGGLVLAAELGRNEALEQRLRAETVMMQRKKDNQKELFERTHDMLKANLRSLSVDEQ